MTEKTCGFLVDTHHTTTTTTTTSAAMASGFSGKQWQQLHRWQGHQRQAVERHQWQGMAAMASVAVAATAFVANIDFQTTSIAMWAGLTELSPWEPLAVCVTWCGHVLFTRCHIVELYCRRMHRHGKTYHKIVWLVELQCEV